MSFGGDVRDGGDIEEVETESLGMPPVAKTTLRLFPQPWPSDSLPPPTASLLSIASKRGLLAAAGPDSLVVVRTDDLRQQYISRVQTKDDSGALQKTKLVVPQVSIQIPRVSHVAFSADESCLVIVAEQGGGLAVYDTNALSPDAKPAFQLSTNGTSVRLLLPNPSSTAELAHLFGIVLSNGQLLLADLKQQKLVTGANGSPVFHEKVCCAAWSRLGKQIIAGLEDGTAAQIDQSGTTKDRVPPPPQLAQLRQDIYHAATALPITSIYWVTKNEFLLIYSPVNPPPGDDLPPTDDSTYFFAVRDQIHKTWTFNKLAADPCAAFVQHRTRPAGHFIHRLTDWPPSLKELFIFSSSASIDIGLMTNNGPDLSVTMIKDESRRPTMPMDSNEEDTTPVGMVVDLSSRIVPELSIPALSDILEKVPAPVPALCVLNTEGVLDMRWIIYNDSIRFNTTYKELVHQNGPYLTYEDIRRNDESGKTTAQNLSDTPSMNMMTNASAQPPAQTPKLSAPASTFGSPGGSAFGGNGKQQQQPAFGKPTFGAPSFGSAPALGQSKSPWGTSTSTNSAAAAPATSTFGKPSFGSTSAIGHASPFSQVSSTVTNKASLWTVPSESETPQTPANPSTFGNVLPKSPFSSFGSNNTTTSPFAAFANNNNQASGFATLGQKNLSSPSPFGGQTGQLTAFGNAGKQSSSLAKETSMGSTATLGSTGSSFSFGQPSGPSSAKESASFVSKPTLSKEATMEDESTDQNKQQSGGLLGLGGGGFKLGSLFKGDGSAKEDSSKPKDAGPGLFGSNFGSALGAVQEEKTSEPPKPSSQEPVAASKPSIFSIPPSKSSQNTQAPAPVKKEEETTKVIPEPAPLPPDFSATKPTPQGVPKDVPLPPFPSGSTKKDSENEPPLAGSPPVDLGNERFSSGDGSEDGPKDEEEWESNSDEEEEDDDEGEEEDDEEGEEDEDEEDEEPYQVEDAKGLSAFQQRLQPPDPKGKQTANLSTTPPSAAKVSFTPAGPPPNLRGGPVFPPPAAEPLRSPSPVRGSFGIPPHPQVKQGGIPPFPPVQRSVPVQPTAPQEPSIGELEDEAAARVQQTINAPIKPDKALPVFYTHDEYTGTEQYTGTAEKPGLGGQIEKVYRDVNSMIDVLGLNAWSLTTFIEGQAQLMKPGERNHDDLEDEEAWTLNEVPALHALVEQLDQQLQAGKLDNTRETLHELREDEKDVLKVKTKAIEIRKLVAARTDPEQLAMHAAAPLSADTLAQQSSLRQGVQKVQKLLAEVEQKMTVLRADLASLASSSPSTSTNPSFEARMNASVSSVSNPPPRPRVPTVEAVTRTIQRMTAMVQERSGDIDVLEAQIRALDPADLRSSSSRHRAAALDDDYEDDLVSKLGSHRLLANSSSGSPGRSFATPTKARGKRMAANGDALGMSAMFGVSAGSARGSRVVFSPEASALARSGGSLSASARKRMVDVTGEEVREWNSRLERRGRVLEALKGRVRGKGVRVVKVGGAGVIFEATEMGTGKEGEREREKGRFG